MLHTKENGYGSWRSIKLRCNNPSYVSYHLYGARGIFVCKGISNSFEHFISVIGKRPSMKHSVDRTDNNKSYTCGICEDCSEHGWPMNVRWATSSQQMFNRNPWRKKSSMHKIGSIYITPYGMYRARYWLNGRNRQIGQFETLIQAQHSLDKFVASL